LGSRIENQEAFAVGVRLHLAHQDEVDDGRALDALEAARVEPLFQILHRLAKDERIFARLDAHVIAGRVDTLDRIDIDSEDLALVLDVDHLLEAVGRRGFDAASGELLGGFRGMFDQRFLEAFGLAGAAFFREPLAHAVHGRGEAILVDRLHQIIDRLGVERAERMVAIGGDEHE
jgi:hypothetical protein